MKGGGKSMIIRNVRDQIESIIKTKEIDRDKFFEVSKQKHEHIKRVIEDTFVDKTNWKSGIHWVNTNGWYQSHFEVHSFYAGHKQNWYHLLPKIVDDPNVPVWVLFEDINLHYWVYEGYVDELMIILDNASVKDYYIVSKKLLWLITENHHECVHFVGKGLKTKCFENEAEFRKR